MPDPCREWRGEIAAVALQRSAPNESERVLLHCAGCPACARELDDLRRVSATLPNAELDYVLSGAVPPNDLRQRILDRVRDEQDRRRGRRRRRVGAAALAAAAVVALVLGFTIAAHDSHTDTPTAFDVATPGSAGSFALHGDGQGTTVRFRHGGLDPSQVYWLWLTDAACNRVGAGTFHGAATMTELTLHAALPLDQVVRVWVTDRDNQVVLDKSLFNNGAATIDPWSTTPSVTTAGTTGC